MKIAKLKIKIILAMVLLGYQYDIVDETGVKTDYLPKPDWNDIHQVRNIPKQTFKALTLLSRRPDLWVNLCI